MKIGLITLLPLDTHGVANYSHFLLKAFLNETKRDEFIVFSTSRTRPHHEDSLRIIPVLETQGDYSPRLANEVSKLRPDILHIQHDYEIFGFDARFLDLLEILKTEGIKTVVTMHSVYENSSRPGYIMNVNIEDYQREIAMLSDLVLVHHGFPARRILIRSGAPQRKIKVLRHGTWNYEKQDKLSARWFLGLPEEDIIISVIASYGPLTDTDFLEAVPFLKNSKKRILFWIVGNSEKYGFDQDALEKYAIMKGYGNNVIVSDIMIPMQWIKQVFSASDIVLIPTRGERESTEVLHYALPALRPAVISEKSMAQEEVDFFISHKCLYHPGDPESLGKLIIEVLEDESFREKISNRMARYSLQTDWRNIARLHLNLYKSLERESIYPTPMSALG